jgi:hypothetical protein
MPYVKRDSANQIIGLNEDLNDPEAGKEWLPFHHPDICEYLKKISGPDESKAILVTTDQEMIRIIEDVVDLLVRKKIISITDLPEEAQRKLVTRDQVRMKLDRADKILADDDKIF